MIGVFKLALYSAEAAFTAAAWAAAGIAGRALYRWRKDQ